MSVNGIGAGYQTADHGTGRTKKSVAGDGFGEQAVKVSQVSALQKAEETAEDTADALWEEREKKAFERIGANAPEEVKRAWMETAKEVNVNGLGMQKNGMLSHISQMMVEQIERSWTGKDPHDILGSSAASALRAIKQALYDLDHPLANIPRSMEVQQARMKEREFYVTFIQKLEQL